MMSRYQLQIAQAPRPRPRGATPKRTASAALARCSAATRASSACCLSGAVRGVSTVANSAFPAASARRKIARCGKRRCWRPRRRSGWRETQIEVLAPLQPVDTMTSGFRVDAYLARISSPLRLADRPRRDRRSHHANRAGARRSSCAQHAGALLRDVDRRPAGGPRPGRGARAPLGVDARLGRSAAARLYAGEWAV